MTKQETLKHFKTWCQNNIGNHCSDEDFQMANNIMALLEQQPCEDCISREQAVDAVADLFEMSEYPHPYPQGKPIRLKDIKEKLKQLPPVQPKPKTEYWIPVSERLPKKEGLYLVSVKNDHERRYSKTCWFHGKGNWFARQDVEAWMPLPKHYEPQESEDKE